jgi:hypothetical protein
VEEGTNADAVAHANARVERTSFMMMTTKENVEIGSVAHNKGLLGPEFMNRARIFLVGSDIHRLCSLFFAPKSR